MKTKVDPTVEKWRKKIEKLGNDVMRGNKIECKCPTCGDRAYGYDTEIKAKDSWIFVELSSLYERLLSHITEPTHSLISKIPSAYGVGSANLSEWDKWESDFDKKFDYRPYNEGDSWYTILDKKDYNPASLEQIKDFIRHSVQEAKAEERKLVVGEIKDNLRVIKKGTTGDMRTAISSVEAMWALNTDPEYRAIYKSSDEYKKDITKAEIKLIERLISFRSPYVYDKYSSLGQQGNQINSEYFIEEGKLLESIRTDLLASLKQEEEKV